MSVVALSRAADFATWRAAARRLALAGARPETIIWRTPEAGADLFSAPEPVEPAPPKGQISAPGDFIEMAKFAVCHRDAGRYDLLYRILLRLQVENSLWNRTIDPDIYRLRELARAVHRDRHKMTAFVRFREVVADEGAAYIAWFEPTHHIVELTAPFFVERFAALRWSILTPERSVHWAGERLVFGPGALKSQAPTEDALEEIWRTYYASIFNPARLKPAAMQREMPKKYWANLPEAPLIGDLMRRAGARESEMIAKPASKAHPRAAAVLKHQKKALAAPPPPRDSLEEVREEAAHCTRCPLYKNATQTVFGEGSRGARLVFVGEQPGDQEDLAGKPFIGPAGQMFDRALAEAGIARKDAYVTNAVKHFKYEPRGKRRIHQKPTAGEIDVCRWWLDQELALIKPKLAVALGATAARGLTGKSLPVMASRGKVFPGHFAERVFVTVHPSFLLRLPDEESREREWGAFVRDLVKVRKLMEAA